MKKIAWHFGRKSRLSRQIGIPLTRSGRQREFGVAMGCVTFVLPGMMGMFIVLWLAVR